MGAKLVVYPVFVMAVTCIERRFSCLHAGNVVAAGSRLLGNGRVGVGGNFIVDVLCCGVVPLGKRVMVWLVPLHACCKPRMKMRCRWSWWR